MKYSKISLYLLASIMASSQMVFGTDVLKNEADGSNGYRGSQQMQPPSLKVSTHISFKDKYRGFDPYKLEEQHQKLFREKNFPEAAEALVASAISDELSENRDYLLKLNPQALTYIDQDNTEQIQALLVKVAEDLALQFTRYYQKPVQTLTLDAYNAFPENDKLEEATKKIPVK